MRPADLCIINRRIGGLENQLRARRSLQEINRRIGGLEKPYYPVGLFQFRQNFFFVKNRPVLSVPTEQRKCP